MCFPVRSNEKVEKMAEILNANMWINVTMSVCIIWSGIYVKFGLKSMEIYKCSFVHVGFTVKSNESKVHMGHVCVCRCLCLCLIKEFLLNLMKTWKSCQNSTRFVPMNSTISVYKLSKRKWNSLGNNSRSEHYKNHWRIQRVPPPPPTGSISFVFAYIFAEKCMRRRSAPPPPPTGNPGSATENIHDLGSGVNSFSCKLAKTVIPVLCHHYYQVANVTSTVGTDGWATVTK